VGALPSVPLLTRIGPSLRFECKSTHGILIEWSPPSTTGKAAALDNRANRQLAGVTRRHIGMHNVGIAEVNDPDSVEWQIGGVVLVIVRPAMSEGVERRGLTDCARSEAGAGRYCVPISFGLPRMVTSASIAFQSRLAGRFPNVACPTKERFSRPPS
jgi:hypothetical protein